MKELYPEFADRVAFFAVNIDPTESLPDLEKYREEQQYPWPVTEPSAGMLSDFRVLQQSTKVAFDSLGVITYRDGYGDGDVDTWRGVFQGLAGSATE